MKPATVYSSLLILAGVLILGFVGVRVAKNVVRPASPQRPAARPTPTVVAQAATETVSPAFPTAMPSQANTPLPETATSPAVEAAAVTRVTVTTSTADVASPAATSEEATARIPTATAVATATAWPSATAAATVTLTLPPIPIATATLGFPRVVINKIGVSAGLVDVGWSVQETSDGFTGQWDTAALDVAGHHLGSARPGDEGNVVLSGHGSEQGVFARLDELTAGDEIRIEMSASEGHVYWVAESVLLLEVGASLQERLDNARYIEPTDDSRLTLVTCWPAWAYTHRLVVIARTQAP